MRSKKRSTTSTDLPQHRVVLLAGYIDRHGTKRLLVRQDPNHLFPAANFQALDRTDDGFTDGRSSAMVSLRTQHNLSQGPVSYLEADALRTTGGRKLYAFKQVPPSDQAKSDLIGMTEAEVIDALTKQDACSDSVATMVELAFSHLTPSVTTKATATALAA